MPDSLGSTASLDAVLHRLELAFRAFFRRVKAGQTPGAPRFKSAHVWNQIEFPHGDRAIKFDEGQRRMMIPGVGWVKLRKGRIVPPTFGETRIFKPLRRLSSSRSWRTSSSLTCIVTSPFGSN